MDTKQLAAFCAVVERKSFSQAADRLGVTQPAVSLQIRSLEQRLGRRLLDRSGRRGEPARGGPRPFASPPRPLPPRGPLLQEPGSREGGPVPGPPDLRAAARP